MDTRERHADIQNLKKHREYHALRLELEDFCKELDSLEDLDLTNPKRVDLVAEIYGRRWASQKITDLLSKLGLVDKSNIKRDITFE